MDISLSFRRLPACKPASPHPLLAPTRTTTNSSYLPAFLAVAILFSSPAPTEETLANIPQTLSGEESSLGRIQRPRTRMAETCTAKCVATCILGGAGAPGEGPFNIRRPLVVFKQGFRSRHYCLTECSSICNLIKDGDDGP